MSNSIDNIKEFLEENYVLISIVLIVLSIIYINIKINNVDYKLRNAIINNQKYQDYSDF